MHYVPEGETCKPCAAEAEGIRRAGEIMPERARCPMTPPASGSGPVDVGAMRALAEKATPGPWAKAAHGQERRGAGDQWWSVNRAYNDGPVLMVNQGRQVCRVMSLVRGDGDAAFIAAARTFVPAACEELERLRAENAALREQVATARALVPGQDEARRMVGAKKFAWFDITLPALRAALAGHGGG